MSQCFIFCACIYRHGLSSSIKHSGRIICATRRSSNDTHDLTEFPNVNADSHASSQVSGLPACSKQPSATSRHFTLATFNAAENFAKYCFKLSGSVMYVFGQVKLYMIQ